jgi:diketogulonate reductase-like aldo/keto reductase
MKYKPLSGTGVSVPEIGFGSWDYRRGLEPLTKGISLGAASIDTRESYDTGEIIG